MKIILWGGIFSLLGSFFLIKRNMKNLEVERTGTLVEMKIIEMPKSCLGTKTKHYVTLSYNGEKFVKRVGGGINM